MSYASTEGIHGPHGNGTQPLCIVLSVVLTCFGFRVLVTCKYQVKFAVVKGTAVLNVYVEFPTSALLFLARLHPLVTPPLPAPAAWVGTGAGPRLEAASWRSLELCTWSLSTSPT